MKEQEAAVLLAGICVRKKEDEGVEGVRSAARVEVRLRRLKLMR